jgi:hypothetical protein
MSTTPEIIAGSGGSTKSVFPVISQKDTYERDFILSVTNRGEDRYANVAVYYCNLVELEKVVELIESKSVDVAVIVDCTLTELLKELKNNSYRWDSKIYKFIAARSK